MSSSFFLEERMLGDIIGIISQKRSKETKVQVIQTISILVQNIRDEKSLCSVFPRVMTYLDFILSNNLLSQQRAACFPSFSLRRIPQIPFRSSRFVQTFLIIRKEWFALLCAQSCSIVFEVASTLFFHSSKRRGIHGTARAAAILPTPRVLRDLAHCDSKRSLR